MKPIQMVDLGSQYLEIKDAIDHKIQEILQSSRFIGGPEVQGLQQELEAYLGVKHVIPCANGTDALQIAMMALGLKPGDEVITASFTYVATAEVIALLGLTPVLVDVDPETFCLDPQQVEAAITPKTKAIVPVHLFGQCAPMKEIMQIANEHELFVIEDTAQAIGADYLYENGTSQKAGTIGHIGCTSFFPSKNLGCYGDGGAIFTNDDILAEKLRIIANHGQTAQYYHDFVGVNSRLDAIQAAVLRCKLPHLDTYNKKRLSVAKQYNEAFAKTDKLRTPSTAGYTSHVFHQYTLQLAGVDRNALKAYLAEHQIPGMIYYPVPLHQQKAYRDARYPDGHFPVSENLAATVFSLPISPNLTEEQQAYSIKHVMAFVG
ncbi:aminotransferase class I/II-fold pyridoxal phosphate-dependent enzyme [bacterium]|nr:aminotransferase class I/II-fold pyridoxal phosphate-dependent enzyme [bacterium]